MPDDLSRWIIRDVYALTRGAPMQWVPVETMTRRLSLSDGVMTDQAIDLARRMAQEDK